jgi:hypothetical protein
VTSTEAVGIEAVMVDFQPTNQPDSQITNQTTNQTANQPDSQHLYWVAYQHLLNGSTQSIHHNSAQRR